MTLDPNLKVQIDRTAGTIDIRQSAVSTFLDCRRSFYWSYLQGIEPDYPDRQRPWTTADTGTAVHEGIGGYYLGLDPLVAMEAWIAEQWPDDEILDNKGKPADLDLPRIMVEGHVNDLAEGGHDLGETTTDVEAPIIATVHNVRGWEVTVHGRIDRLVQTEDDKLIIDDIKSVGPFMPIDNYLSQLMRYALLVRQETGLRADRVRTTQIRRVKRQGQGPFFQRAWAPVNEEMYRMAAINLRAVLSDITSAIETDGPWYEHRTGECDWKCRVEDVCKAQVRGDDPEIIVDLHYRPKGQKDNT